MWVVHARFDSLCVVQHRSIPFIIDTLSLSFVSEPMPTLQHMQAHFKDVILDPIIPFNVMMVPLCLANILLINQVTLRCIHRKVDMDSKWRRRTCKTSCIEATAGFNASQPFSFTFPNPCDGYNYNRMGIPKFFRWMRQVA